MATAEATIEIARGLLRYLRSNVGEARLCFGIPLRGSGNRAPAFGQPAASGRGSLRRNGPSWKSRGNHPFRPQARGA